MMRGTFFESLYAGQGRRFSCSWGAFADRCREPREFEAKEVAPRWVAATFRENRRRLRNLESACAVVLDVDDGTTVDAIAAVVDFAIIHPTWSSGADRPRSRVTLPTSRPISEPEHRRVWRAVAIHLERHGIKPDLAARDATHLWSVPAIKPGARPSYSVRVTSGPLLDVEAALRALPEEKPIAFPSAVRDASLAKRIERARAYIDSCEPAVSGAGGHAQTFRVALALVRGFELDEEEALSLLAEYNERCQPPWSRWELQYKLRSAAQRGRREPGWLANARRVA